MGRTRRAMLISMVCLLAVGAGVGIAVAKKKKIVVGSGTVTLALPSPATAGSNYTFSGTIVASKGCQAGRFVQLSGSAISSGSGGPSHLDGTFGGTLTAGSSPGVGTVQATIPSRPLFKHGTNVKRHGRFVYCKRLVGPVVTMTVVPPGG